MIRNSLGNFTTFNALLQLSSRNTHCDTSMSSANRGYASSGEKMSALVSGSVADDQNLEHTQYDFSVPSTSVRSGVVYDPFASRTHSRYSPSQESFAESSQLDSFESSRNFAAYDTANPRLISHISQQAYPGCEPYSSGEGMQRMIVIDNEPSTRRRSQDSFGYHTSSEMSQDYLELDVETHRRNTDAGRNPPRYQAHRRPSNQDEFDGPSQLLPLPLPQQDSSRAQEIPTLPTHLDIAEQEDVLHRANNILSECAFHFVAKYQFPVPLERDKPRVRSAADREWTEWAYLLKRLATKRRIPARILYDNQIKQLVTVLENSIPARQSTNKNSLSPSRRSKDDRYILQTVSAGIQVAKILMDSLAMQQLDELYVRTEAVILDRRQRAQLASGPI